MQIENYYLKNDRIKNVVRKKILIILKKTNMDDVKNMKVVCTNPKKIKKNMIPIPTILITIILHTF